MLSSTIAEKVLVLKNLWTAQDRTAVLLVKVVGPTLLMSMSWIMVHISRDVSYPYLAQEGTCSNKTTKRANISVVGYRGIDNENEEALKEAVGKYKYISQISFKHS